MIFAKKNDKNDWLIKEFYRLIKVRYQTSYIYIYSLASTRLRQIVFPDYFDTRIALSWAISSGSLIRWTIATWHAILPLIFPPIFFLRTLASRRWWIFHKHHSSPVKRTYTHVNLIFISQIDRFLIYNFYRKSLILQKEINRYKLKSNI